MDELPGGSDRISNAGYKRPFNVNVHSNNNVNENVKDNKTVDKDANKVSNGDDFVEVKE